MIGALINFKAWYIKKSRELQGQVTQILETMQNEQIQPVYSTSEMKLTINNPADIHSRISIKLSAYCLRSEKVFNEILKLHPKFRPKYFERSHHIFCIKLDQNKNNKVSFDEIKVIANFVSKKLDIPVSVQADSETLSLALFWDTRIFGSLKFFDHPTFVACRALDID